jgi:hypothetical protein
VIGLFLSIFLPTRPSCWWLPISMSSCLTCKGIFTCDAYFLHCFSFLCNISQPVLPFIATEMISSYFIQKGFELEVLLNMVFEQFMWLFKPKIIPSEDIGNLTIK